MKRTLLKLLALLLALVALAAALGPTAARQYRQWRDGRAAEDYRAAAQAMDTLEQGAMLAQARRHNEALGSVRLTDPFGEDAELPRESDDYDALLDPAENGIMAVLEIPKLGALMPVYHGARDAALGAGVGHLQGTSLPAGGGALCALVARRGGWLGGPFSGLERLIPGDHFYIEALGERLAYRVSQTLTLTPDELEAGDFGGDDVCALLTTTPYGEDTQRLLVLGERVSRRAAASADDTRELAPWASRLIFAAPVALVGLLLVALVEGLRRAAARRRLKRVKL